MTRTHIPPALSDTPSFCIYASQKRIWRYKVMMEATFGISVLEPWEKLVLLIAMSLIVSLFATGCVRYLPHLPLRFAGLQYRLAYYLWGNEGGIRPAVT